MYISRPNLSHPSRPKPTETQGPPFAGGAQGPPFTGGLRAPQKTIFYRGALGPHFISGGPWAPSLSGGPGGLCPPRENIELYPPTPPGSLACESFFPTFRFIDPPPSPSRRGQRSVKQVGLPPTPPPPAILTDLPPGDRQIQKSEKC